MNILYIDPISPKGHVRFNKIHIEALQKSLNVKVTLVCSEYMAKALGGLADDVAYTYTDIDNKKSPLVIRLRMLLIQWTIFFKLKFSYYDAVIFAYYDSMIFWLTPFRHHKMFVVNHINILELNNRVKRFCIKHITKRCTHIVFNEYMKKGMLKWGVNNVAIVPHGFEYMEYGVVASVEKYIFCPSENSADYNFIKEIVSSKKLKDYLEKNEIHLIVKGDFDSDCSNISFIRCFQPMEEYIRMFQNAWLILLAYSDRIDYRCSGVLNECFSMNKKCIINDCENFRIYEEYFTYNPFFFKNITSLIEALIRVSDVQYGTKYYIKLDENKPDIGWRNLLL